MLSPAPTQQPPVPEAKPEQKKVVSTPVKRRAGQTPAARFVKAIGRPPIKGLYYLFQGIRNHKLVTLIVILLLLVSETAANYAVTREWPFGIGGDPFQSLVHGNVGGDQVEKWLYALKSGDARTMQALQQFAFAQTPDPQQLVDQYSNQHFTWKAINVVGIYTESDTTVDSIVEIDLASKGPGATVGGILIFHFTTLPSRVGEIIYIHLVDFRAPLPAGLQ